MRNKMSVLSAAGVAAAIAIMVPPSVGSKTRNAIKGGMRGCWKLISSPFARPHPKRTARKGTMRRPAARTTRKAV